MKCGTNISKNLSMIFTINGSTCRRELGLRGYDIFELGKNGSLIQILVRKIRDLDKLSGLPTTIS
jgi:hypothetical protein